MRKVFAIVYLLTSLAQAQTKFDNDPNKKESTPQAEQAYQSYQTKPDTSWKQHIVFSAIGTTAGYLFLRGAMKVKPVPAVFISAGLVLAAGYLKELTDDRYNVDDIRANYAGVGIAGIPILVWRF